MVTIIFLVTFFILSGSDDCDSIKASATLNNVYESVFMAVLIVGTLWVSVQIGAQFTSPP